MCVCMCLCDEYLIIFLCGQSDKKKRVVTLFDTVALYHHLSLVRVSIVCVFVCVCDGAHVLRDTRRDAMRRMKDFSPPFAGARMNDSTRIRKSTSIGWLAGSASDWHHVCDASGV